MSDTDETNGINGAEEDEYDIEELGLAGLFLGLPGSDDEFDCCIMMVWCSFALAMWIIQGTMLRFLWGEVATKCEEESDPGTPFSILYVCVLVHTMTILTKFPLALREMIDACTRKNLCFIYRPMVFIDSFVVPSATLCIGGMFVASADSPSDAVLNAVAVAFITEIDNVCVKSIKMYLGKQTVQLPVLGEDTKHVLACVCGVIPVVPFAMAAGITWAGLALVGRPITW